MHITIPSHYKKILKPIENIDFFFVGGFVRDLILQRKPNDIDIIIFTSIEALEEQLGQQAFIVNERFKTARFMIKGTIIDVNTAQSLEEDIMRRDFTVNALCANKSGLVFDYVNGYNDIKDKILRPVTRQAFSLDPVRILRAYRFRNNFQFQFSRGMKTLIHNEASNILQSAPERILQEFHLLFSDIGSSNIMYDMYIDGVLNSVFPELNSTRNFYHKKCGTRTLANHMLKTVRCVDLILNDKHMAVLKAYCRNHIFDLYLAALFHDIEKPKMEKKTAKGLSFAGHDISSAKTASLILKNRLRLPKENISRISKWIRMHMRPHLLVESEKVTRRGFFRLMRDAGDDLPGLFALAIADKFASDCIMDTRYIKLYENVLNVRKAIEEKKINIINGNEIMNAFGLKPSPLIGKLIESGNEYAIQENINDKGKILDFLREEFNLNV